MFHSNPHPSSAENLSPRFGLCISVDSQFLSVSIYISTFSRMPFSLLTTRSIRTCGSHARNPSRLAWSSTTCSYGCLLSLLRSFLTPPHRLAIHVRHLEISGGLFSLLESIFGLHSTQSTPIRLLRSALCPSWIRILIWPTVFFRSIPLVP